MPTPLIPEPLEKTLLSTRVYNRLRGDIMAGRLAPGERLVEMRLAAELQVSQGTVREAIKRLAAEGLILSVPHRGSHVTTVDPSEARPIYRVRAALERVAATDFCANATSADLDAVAAQLEAMRTAAAAGDGDSVVIHDATFHRLIWERSGNPLLGRMWELIEPSMRRLTPLSNRLYYSDLNDIAELHRPLLDVLRNRDAELAADLFAAHAEGIWHQIDDPHIDGVSE